MWANLRAAGRGMSRASSAYHTTGRSAKRAGAAHAAARIESERMRRASMSQLQQVMIREGLQRIEREEHQEVVAVRQLDAEQEAAERAEREAAAETEVPGLALALAELAPAVGDA